MRINHNRSPHFGWNGKGDGDTAWKKRTHRPPPARAEQKITPCCPNCGANVRWETDGSGDSVLIEAGRIHVCDPDATLTRLQREEGATLLSVLRGVINERRMYGETVR